MPITEIRTKSLDEFWNIISSVGGVTDDMKNPIFRGQGDAAWALTPSALREEIISKYKNSARIYTQTEQIIFFEYFMLLDFLHYSDKMKFVIPNDSPEFREYMNRDKFFELHGINTIGWPSKEYFSFIALAQHHGIPTRLLDWTKSPLIAAYFAASQALNLNTPSKDLAVWIIDSEVLKTLDNRLEYVVLPDSTSSNLAAQRGVFLIHRQQNGMGRDTQFSAEDLRDSVSQIFEKNENCTAFKIILSAHLAGDLLFRCSESKISASTLFPGFDGAAKAALEYKIAKKLSGKL